MKKVVVLILVLAFMLVSVTSTFAAGCGNWQIYKVDSSKCYDNWCYNIPFNPYESWGQKVYEKRNCVRNDNTTYWEYRDYIAWNGCCNI